MGRPLPEDLARQRRERLSRQRKRRSSGSVLDVPTATDNLLYLLAELENAVERPNVEWSAALSASVQRRLEDLVHLVAQAAHRRR
jgi:hypothetical protein